MNFNKSARVQSPLLRASISTPCVLNLAVGFCVSTIRSATFIREDLFLASSSNWMLESKLETIVPGSSPAIDIPVPPALLLNIPSYSQVTSNYRSLLS